MIQASQNLNLQSEWQGLARTQLDTLRAAPFGLHGLLVDTSWLRIAGLSSFWESPQLPSLGDALRDAFVGLHAIHQAPSSVTAVSYLIIGTGREVKLYAGIGSQPPMADSAAVLASIMNGTLPGIELQGASALTQGSSSIAPIPGTELSTQLDREHYFGVVAYATGIPTTSGEAPSAPRIQEHAQHGSAPKRELIERLIRGLAAGKWGYLVRANPLPDTAIRAALSRHLQLHTQASSLLKFSETVNETSLNRQIGPGAAGTSSVSRSAERTNRDAQLLMDALDCQIARLERGQAEGMWDVRAFVFSPDATTAGRAAALLKACFGGAESRPEPFRVAFPTPDGSLGLENIATAINSTELSALAALPRQEFSGLRVTDYATFDLDAPSLQADSIPIGRIMNGYQPSGGWLGIRTDDLAKHALVVGITGSGKTTTIFSLLHKLRTRSPRVPFLVIEPAKTEYRRLLSEPVFADLRIYTLSDERTAPFRLNPFEFDIDSQDPSLRTHVQTHIDYLKSVFNAAFVLYAPMPYMLDIALHEIYLEKGWDFATGYNQRLAGASPHYPGLPLERAYGVFPTLSDLWRKVGEVVDRTAYEDRLKGDIRAGLQARIDSLRQGAKGMMLDVSHGLDIDELLKHPTVVELDRIGNDDEKAFVIGLLLTRIAARRRLQRNGPLRHVTVIEEAHRLLKNVDTEVGTEESSSKASAVETFSNMLSEIRAYGEGVIIAEQIPMKLAPDAIKNTNLKLLHRMVAEDDRKVVGASMNLNDVQSRRVVTLGPGEAIAFAEGCDRPYLLRIPVVGSIAQVAPQDALVQTHMARHLPGDMLEPAQGFGKRVFDADPHVNLSLRNDSRRLARLPELREAVLSHLFSTMDDPPSSAGRIVSVMQPIRRAHQGRGSSYEQKLAIGSVMCCIADLADEMCTLHSAPYTAGDGFRQQWTGLVCDAIQAFSPAMTPRALQELIDDIASRVPPLALAWKTLAQSQFGPHVGCAPCGAKCLFREVGSMLARMRPVVDDINEALDGSAGRGVIVRVSDACDRAARRVVSNPDTVRHLRVCIACHFAHKQFPDNPLVEAKLARDVSSVQSNQTQ